MIAKAETVGKKLMVGQICRVAPGFALAKKILDAGTIGEIFFLESEYAHDYADIRGWRMDPLLKRHPVTGGGYHAVDLVRFLTGKEPVEASPIPTTKCFPIGLVTTPPLPF